jgi:SAM-dependent methyltransferase
MLIPATGSNKAKQYVLLNLSVTYSCHNHMENVNDYFRALYADRSFRSVAFPDAADMSYLNAHLLERSIRLLAAQLTGDLLDVGCGQQPYRSYFDHVASHRACDFDALRGNVDFACPADRIPLACDTLDSILCTEVLEHVTDPLAVWREFYRVLRPAGQVLLTTPMYWPPHELPYDYHRHTEHGLRHMVSESGFELIALVPRGGPWAMWGQVTLHVVGHYFPFRSQRAAWNRLILWIDRRCDGPRLTMGWTVLARKRSGNSDSRD